MLVMAVQVPAVGDAPEVVAQGNAELRGKALEDLGHGLPVVDVLVGVEVGGLATGERAKARKLAVYLRLDRLRVAVDGHDLVHGRPGAVPPHPLAQVDVQPDAERRRGPRVGRGLLRPGLADHQAGAGQDALLVGARDARVHARAEAEVVGVDDQGAIGHRSRRLLRRRVARQA